MLDEDEEEGSKKEKMAETIHEGYLKDAELQRRTPARSQYRVASARV